ncbi:MAG: TRAP transporter TAXI family solute receptor [Paracoccaceae bacterium]|jgi:TRAP transporter TAXI family solute receptor
MNHILNKGLRFATAATFAAGLMASGAAAEIYKVTSIAPGMSPFVVNTAIAKVVNNHVDDVDFQVRATGAATKHMIDAATGSVDFLFGSPTINWLLVNQIGPYKKFTNGPELEAEVGMIFSYQIGPYHYVTRADSGIETLEDMRGRTVFAGPPGGAAKGVVLRNIKAVTGLEATDMKVQEYGFDAAIQAFQDDKIDVIVLPTNVPSPAIQQFSLTKEIRILNVDVSKLDLRPAVGGTFNKIEAGDYRKNQVNETSIDTHGAIVNFSAGMHVDEEVVYQVTKAIWENIGEIQETAQWMPSTINKEHALDLIAGRLHPGAERYYREMGWQIPEATVYLPTQ